MRHRQIQGGPVPAAQKLGEVGGGQFDHASGGTHGTSCHGELWKPSVGVEVSDVLTILTPDCRKFVLKVW
jgi:hypothetical protein